MVIYTDDDDPAHMHVVRAGAEAIFILNCPDRRPKLRENRDFTFTEVNCTDRLVQKRTVRLCQELEAIHSDDVGV